jgi:hypothetical protein
MKFMQAPLLGIVGGIAFGSWGLVPNFGSAIFGDLTPQQVVARKVAIPAGDIEPGVEGQLVARHASTECMPTPSLIADHPVASAIEALRQKVTLLEKGHAFLHRTAGYTAKMHKQEVVKDELLDEQTIFIKCRHKPFSVYLRWLTGDAGREVIYVDGANDGKLIAHDGGWKARIPAFSLSTTSMLAMRDARYPVTDAGLLGLTDTMAAVHRMDLDQANVDSCEVDHTAQFDGRPCVRFTTRYKSVAVSPQYRKSITLIDQEWNVPIHSRHFEWGKAGVVSADNELDDATMVESYSFSEIEFGQQLTESDFDRENPEYQFR